MSESPNSELPASVQDAQPTVRRDDAHGRYEIHLGEVLAGFTEFEIDARGRLVFPHTEIDPAFKGKGLGGVLVAQAMADVAARGETVVPRCPFVVRWLRENDVAGLVVAGPAATGGGGV